MEVFEARDDEAPFGCDVRMARTEGEKWRRGQRCNDMNVGIRTDGSPEEDGPRKQSAHRSPTREQTYLGPTSNVSIRPTHQMGRHTSRMVHERYPPHSLNQPFKPARKKGKGVPWNLDVLRAAA